MNARTMVTVYRAANAGEAHLLRGMLEQQGIEAQVSGESLAGAVGELPATALEVDLLVPRALADRARVLIRQYEGYREVEQPWQCRGCGEDNPTSFEVCWRCGDPRD